MTMTEWKVSTRRRLARTPHHCIEGRPNCTYRIAPGDVYLEVVVYPGHDAITATVPQRVAVCAPCAISRHSQILDPIPYEQCARQGLL